MSSLSYSEPEGVVEAQHGAQAPAGLPCQARASQFLHLDNGRKMSFQLSAQADPERNPQAASLALPGDRGQDGAFRVGF